MSIIKLANDVEELENYEIEEVSPELDIAYGETPVDNTGRNWAAINAAGAGAIPGAAAGAIPGAAAGGAAGAGALGANALYNKVRKNGGNLSKNKLGRWGKRGAGIGAGLGALGGALGGGAIGYGAAQTPGTLDGMGAAGNEFARSVAGGIRDGVNYHRPQPEVVPELDEPINLNDLPNYDGIM